jgi:Ca2+-binding RTX toxin-like protein
VFTPDADFNGTATFSYTVSDGQATSTQTVSVMVSNVLPTAIDDTASTDEDTALTLRAAALLANDTDGDGDALALTGVGDALGGTVTLGEGDEVVFTPDADFNGEASFSYTVSDGTDTASAQVTINVAPVNDAPTTSLSSFETELGVTLNADLPATDVDGDILDYGVVAGPQNGTLQLEAGGGFIYTPAARFFGDDSFSYSVADQTATASGTVSIMVTAANLVQGTAESETLNGTAANDLLAGKEGDDVLLGQGGDDRYLYGYNDGVDTIRDQSSTTTSVWVSSGHWSNFGGEGDYEWTDTSYWGTATVSVDAGDDSVAFTDDIDFSDIALKFEGANLIAGIIDDDASFDTLDDRVHMTQWHDKFQRIETLQFGDGSEIDITKLASALQTLGATSSQHAVGTGGFDWITGGETGDVIEGVGGADVLIGLGGNDHLTGGLGNDLLAGGNGDDIFVFSIGDGKDRIADFQAGLGASDVLDLSGHNVGSFDNVQDIATQLGADTVLRLTESDQLTLVGVNAFELVQDDFLL